MAEHGGNSDEAAKAYGMTPEQMYDLSTGISPIAYDMVLPSSSHYQKLPMASALDDLYKAARGAYQVPTHAAICAVQVRKAYLVCCQMLWLGLKSYGAESQLIMNIDIVGKKQVIRWMAVIAVQMMPKSLFWVSQIIQMGVCGNMMKLHIIMR